MCLKIICVSVPVFLRVIILAEFHHNAFAVVSTTQPPSDIQKLADQVAKVEGQVKLQAELNENVRQVDALNIKITKIQERLDALTNAEAHSCLKFESVNYKLDKFQEKFEGFSTSEAHLNSRFDSLDKEMTHTQQRLEAMTNSGAVSCAKFESGYNKLYDKLGSSEAQLRVRFDNIDKAIMKIQERLEAFSNSGLRHKVPKHCKEVQERGHNVTGIYSIQPESAPEAFLVRCNMDIRGGGWTYFHTRYDGKQDFYLDWKDYKQGFGNIAGEFWLGLEHLYQLTGHEVNELLIELVDWDMKKVYAHYTVFSIGNENEGYFLKALGEYSGDGGDSLSYQAGSKFSTKDKDQDSYSGNCATSYVGAWWFKSCFTSHLNGQYLSAILKDPNKNKGISWNGFRGPYYSLKEARMMVRPQATHRN